MSLANVTPINLIKQTNKPSWFHQTIPSLFQDHHNTQNSFMDVGRNVNIGEENFKYLRLESRSTDKNRRQLQFLDMENLQENSLLGGS